MWIKFESPAPYAAASLREKLQKVARKVVALSRTATAAEVDSEDEVTAWQIPYTYIETPAIYRVPCGRLVDIRIQGQHQSRCAMCQAIKHPLPPEGNKVIIATSDSYRRARIVLDFIAREGNWEFGEKEDTYYKRKDGQLQTLYLRRKADGTSRLWQIVKEEESNA